MQIFYYDNGPGDQREPHDSGRPVPVEVLTSIGVYASTHPTIDTVNALATERGYKNRDEITISPVTMGDAYEGKVKNFFTEHLHDDEEIRYILDGNGYFDVRSGKDEWIRCRMGKGDLIILPKGIWHRFTTDDTNYIKALRLFQDEPKWTPINRAPETEKSVVRVEYEQSIRKATAASA